MAKEDETPGANPAEIENLIEQIRGTNLEPGAKEKVERLLRTVLTLVELLQRKNTSIKKLREMIFGKRTERHRARKAEGQDWSPGQTFYVPTHFLQHNRRDTLCRDTLYG